MAQKPTEDEITRHADMFSAMGTGPRLRIMRTLLSAHPDGMVVNEIGGELGIPASTLSHHLEKLKNEGLVRVRREGTYLWFSANEEALQDLLGFLICRMLYAQQGGRTAGDCTALSLEVNSNL